LLGEACPRQERATGQGFCARRKRRGSGHVRRCYCPWLTRTWLQALLIRARWLCRQLRIPLIRKRGRHF